MVCEECQALAREVASLRAAMLAAGHALSMVGGAVRPATAIAPEGPRPGLPANWPAKYGEPGPDVVGASRVSAWCKGFQSAVRGDKPRDNPYDWNSRGHKQAWEKGWMAGSSHKAKGAA